MHSRQGSSFPCHKNPYRQAEQSPPQRLRVSLPRCLQNGEPLLQELRIALCSSPCSRVVGAAAGGQVWKRTHAQAADVVGLQEGTQGTCMGLGAHAYASHCCNMPVGIQGAMHREMQRDIQTFRHARENAWGHMDIPT
eukprot:1138036-Pelagomonas_calceolata.AAC.3